MCFTVCKENIKGTLPFYSHTAILSIRMPHLCCTTPRIQSLMIGLIKALLIPLLEPIQCCSTSPRELSLRQSFQSLDGGLFPKIGYTLTGDIRWSSFLNIQIGLIVVILVEFYPL
jgi:hypothetical protein